MTDVGLPLLVDVRRTNLQRRFFERYVTERPRDVLADVAAERIDAPALIASDDCVIYGYAGWVYWLLYLKGYLEYRTRRTVDGDNLYARYLIDQYLPGPHDPGLREQLRDESTALARVGARFAELDRMLGDGRHGPGIDPIRVLASSRRDDDMLEVRDATSGLVVKARAVDGWHRLFAARLGDVATVPGVVRLDERTWTQAA